MKNIKKVLVLALALGILSSCGIKKSNDKLIIDNSNKKTASAKEAPKGITVNKIDFQEIKDNELPVNFANTINVLKANRGFLTCKDNGSYYVAIFSGQRKTGGYTIKVGSVEDNEGKTNILFEENGPKQGDMVTQAITYPYIVIKISKVTPNFVVKNSSGEVLPKINQESSDY